MDVTEVLLSSSELELPKCFNKRHPLYISNSASKLEVKNVLDILLCNVTMYTSYVHKNIGESWNFIWVIYTAGSHLTLTFISDIKVKLIVKPQYMVVKHSTYMEVTHLIERHAIKVIHTIKPHKVWVNPTNACRIYLVTKTLTLCLWLITTLLRSPTGGF